jgi:hypothetical protein
LLTFLDSAAEPLVRGKQLKRESRRWNPSKAGRSWDHPWKDLVELYIDTWQLQGKQYLLENSPPELLYYKDIVHALRTLRQEYLDKLGGEAPRLALVLLTRSPCNDKDKIYMEFLLHFHRMLLGTDTHQGDIFLLRYEDLCSGPAGQSRLNKELAAFLPGFGHMRFDAVPPTLGEQQQEKKDGVGNFSNSSSRSRRRLSHHDATSVGEYCRDHYVPNLPYRNYTAFGPAHVKKLGGQDAMRTLRASTATRRWSTSPRRCATWATGTSY